MEGLAWQPQCPPKGQCSAVPPLGAHLGMELTETSDRGGGFWGRVLCGLQTPMSSGNENENSANKRVHVLPTGTKINIFEKPSAGQTKHSICGPWATSLKPLVQNKNILWSPTESGHPSGEVKDGGPGLL